MKKRPKLFPIPEDTLPYWRAALEAEEECQQDFEEALGEIDREVALARLKAATEKRDLMQMDILYFSGWLGDPKRPLRQRRPADPMTTWRDKRIAAHSLLLDSEERDSVAQENRRPNLKKAVGLLEELYRVRRSTIFSARKRWCPKLRSLGYDQIPADKRRRRLETLEWVASDPLLRESD
jgi:hypothetical protein